MAREEEGEQDGQQGREALAHGGSAADSGYRQHCYGKECHKFLPDLQYICWVILGFYAVRSAHSESPEGVVAGEIRLVVA